MRPKSPTEPLTACTSWAVAAPIASRPEACVAIAYTIAKACVSTNTVKIGTQMSTDSLTPLRFMSVRPTTPATANPSLKCCAESGNRLKRASAPLATDIVTVRT